MNTKQIIAELRRSACEDADPFARCDSFAFDAARGWKDNLDLSLLYMKRKDIRTFYLLVAEAMESE